MAEARAIDQTLKEAVSAVLALAIVGFTVYFALRTVDLAGDSPKAADTKDVLQVMVGLAGVVLGYYFGRVPADARAAQAQDQMAVAAERATRVSAKGEELASHVDRAFAGAGTASEADMERMRQLRAELRTLTQSR